MANTRCGAQPKNLWLPLKVTRQPAPSTSNLLVLKWKCSLLQMMRGRQESSIGTGSLSFTIHQYCLLCFPISNGRFSQRLLGWHQVLGEETHWLMQKGGRGEQLHCLPLCVPSANGGGAGATWRGNYCISFFPLSIHQRKETELLSGFFPTHQGSPGAGLPTDRGALIWNNSFNQYFLQR